MKYLFLILLCVFLFSCQKDSVKTKESSYPQLRKSLSEQLPAADFNLLDFARISRANINDKALLRICFQGKKMSESFLIVEVDVFGNVLKGKIIEIGESESPYSFTGEIVTKDLSGGNLKHRYYKNGYKLIPTSPVSTNVSMPSQPDPYIMLPEVIVVGSYPPSGGSFGYSTWISALSFIDDYGSGGGDWSGGYVPGDSFGGGGGGGYGGGSGSGYGNGDPNLPSNPSNPNDPNNPNYPVEVIDDPFMQVEFESQFADPAIDVDAYLKCFSQIPDAGAICTIAIFSDIPVDGDPNKMFNFMSGSPGHAFIRIEKKNGGQGIKQYFGMYPAEGWKTNDMVNGTPAKLVDNSNHEYNAYMEINITPQELLLAIEKIRSQKSAIYNLNHYNCTDFALDVWNAASSNQTYLEIPKLHIPGSSYPASNTPQGLYVQIQGLKASGSPIAAASQVNVDGTSGSGKGSCN
ncbi:MAG: hypothetical protein DI535_03595 [Citrobacter freundii]|nr:MAG: hypothetical protein DI535_03595 [Citrobacter freundii]